MMTMMKSRTLAMAIIARVASISACTRHLRTWTVTTDFHRLRDQTHNQNQNRFLFFPATTAIAICKSKQLNYNVCDVNSSIITLLS